jgi:hypothetical protein
MGEKLIGIMLDPARAREDLALLQTAQRFELSVRAKPAGFAAGGSLVDRDDGRHGVGSILDKLDGDVAEAAA